MVQWKSNLVIGGTGKVGGAVLDALGSREVGRIALVRSEARAAVLPEGVEARVGDLGDLASLERAMEGVESVFFITPHHAQEEEFGRNVLRACESQEVARVVFASAYHPDSSSALVRWLIRTLLGWVGPHYRAKLQVEAQARRSPLSPVILMPSNFFQNDEIFREEILAGSYPQPLGPKPISRIDCRDIGEAAARALIGELASGAYPLGGPALSGPQSAALWDAQYDREVVYAGDDLAQWRALTQERMASREVDDYSKTYALMQKYGAPAKAEDIKRAEEAVGRTLTSYETYIADCLQRWR